jgi:glycosyltransferase involved in cell wall biosynthesis
MSSVCPSTPRFDQVKLRSETNSALVRIVFLSPSSQRGGAEAVLTQWIEMLLRARPDWSLHLIAGEDGPLLESPAVRQITHEVLAFPSTLRSLGEERAVDGQAPGPAYLWRLLRGVFSALGYACKLRRRIASLRPTLLHSNGIKMHLLAGLTQKLSRRRVSLVWHLHDYISTRRITARALTFLASEASAAVANSKSVAQDAAQVLRALRRIEVVYNRIDTGRFAPEGDRLDLDALAGFGPAPPGTLRVGLLATFAKWKGHEIFLRAAAGVAPSRPVRFYIIGGPIYATRGSQWQMEELRAQANSLGLEERVGFTGFVENAAAALRALDIVIHASTEPEPFGLVLVQAMACGRALVSTGLGGARELIEPRVDSLIYAANDPAALASHIETLLADPDLRSELAAAGRDKAIRLFSADGLDKIVLPFLESVAS